jgi:hypothetical protein
MLPANNPRLSGLKLASAILHKMAEVKFLNPQDTAAAGRYEGMVKFIQDKHGLTRAEIDNYYRDAIRAEIAKTVAIEFNKNFFDMDRTYITTLSRDPQSGKYTLSYFRPTKKDEVHEVSGQNLDALLVAMSANGLNQNCVNTVREQANLIPATVYNLWKTNGISKGVDGLELAKDTISNFYINPTQENYNAILGIYARIWRSGALRVGSFADYASNSFFYVLFRSSQEFARLISKTVANGDSATLASYPADPRFNIFSMSPVR